VSRADAAGPLRQAQAVVRARTSGPGFYDVTRKVQQHLATMGAGSGVLTLFIRHTSASLVVQENADPTVQADLVDALDGLAPANRRWRHADEGPDDMPAHVKSMLTQTSLAIPVFTGHLQLGTWQAIYVAEHRSAPHEREVALAWIGTIIDNSG